MARLALSLIVRINPFQTSRSLAPLGVLFNEFVLSNHRTRSPKSDPYPPNHPGSVSSKPCGGTNFRWTGCLINDIRMENEVPQCLHRSSLFAILQPQPVSAWSATARAATITLKPFTVAGATNVTVNAINDLGIAVGTYQDGTGRAVGFYGRLGETLELRHRVKALRPFQPQLTILQLWGSTTRQEIVWLCLASWKIRGFFLARTGG